MARIHESSDVSGAEIAKEMSCVHVWKHVSFKVWQVVTLPHHARICAMHAEPVFECFAALSIRSIAQVSELVDHHQGKDSQPIRNALIRGMAIRAQSATFRICGVPENIFLFWFLNGIVIRGNEKEARRALALCHDVR